ncbi:fimbrillin family protein [Hoylesella timonensis]|uniref:fimbrillin family protein n=1 Tax=Hoylesella timonensis TaxID=386414 RepID=UPI00336A7959
MKTTKLLLLSGMFASLGMLASCADDDLANGGDKSDGDKGTAVTFNVSDAQDDAQNAMVTPVAGNTRAFAGPVTRVGFANGLAMQGLTPEDLTSQKLPVSGADNACLIETTTAGVNPLPVQVVDAPQTRANITTINNLPKFSTIGFRGTSSGNATTPWFHNADTNPDGTLVKPIQWSWEQPYGKFFAVAVASTTNPNAKPTLSPEGTAAPYVDFEVKPKVVDQEDLMTACSGEVHYATRFVAPTINLKFRHALTAVRFKVGQNLSWNKTITKVEIIGAKSKGRYMLPTDETGTGAQWTKLSDAKPFTLGGDGTVNVSTFEAVNNIIVGKPGDNFTFYMIPQPLTGNNVQVKVTLDDGKELTSTLSGTWKPGTTKTYALTEDQSDWNYVFTVVRSNNNKLKYDQTDAGTYTVESYRNDDWEDPFLQQPVKWKVVSYQESKDGGVTWEAETTVKPAWLSLSKIEGDGNYTTGESGSATVTKDITDRLALYNKVLQDAEQKGSAGSPYDLSMHNFKGESQTMNTANSYLISAPGYYKIPLVYGNAIKNGSNNTHSYQTANSGSNILQKFKDHAGADITSPYINVQNSSKPATQASIVWTDQRGIVDGLSVTNAGAKSYVNFHVPADKIKNGNAVIAVKNASGTIMWSWHLWFDHKEVLETVKCTNFLGKDYNFTKQTLGFAYRKWVGSTYDKNRIVKVKFEQTVGQKTPGKQHATITIEQEPGRAKWISSTLYQFGRKDAFPGIEDIADGSFTKNGGNNMSVTNGIQHPETFYIYGSTWNDGYNQYNLWSMDNTTPDYNDHSVVKTIYDPCPAGFHMPAPNAFTGFTTNGKFNGPMNVSGAWDYGWHFNNKISSPDATVYFPASGQRYYYYTYAGWLGYVGINGYYWTAVSNGANGAYIWYFGKDGMGTLNSTYRACGFSVRPVSE